jgi:hypothetical protein
MANDNQLIIDLGDINLSDKELKALQKAIHKTVTKKVQKANSSTGNTNVAGAAALTKPALKPKGKTAELQITFSDVEPGLSGLTATHNTENPQTVDRSGTIRFTGVKKNDIIDINGFGAGSKTISINGVMASPMQMNFAAGQHFNGSFLING